jgi:hypothetical protein
MLIPRLLSLSKRQVGRWETQSGSRLARVVDIDASAMSDQVSRYCRGWGGAEDQPWLIANVELREPEAVFFSEDFERVRSNCHLEISVA